MTVRTLLMLALAAGVAGCDGGYPSAPSAVQQPTPTPPSTRTEPRRAVFPPGEFSPYTLSGVVFELTATGRVPLEGVSVYCELCGEETHSWAFTDSKGIYSFTGVWTTPGVGTPVWFGKEGYADPSGVQRNADGLRILMIDSDTRVDIQLVRE
jgi:hypothetical protein